MDRYIKLYLWIVEDENLTYCEKVFLTMIFGLSEKNGFCSAGDDYFSKILKVDKRRVRTLVHNLEEKGYIIRDTQDGKRIIYPVEKEYVYHTKR